MARQVTRTTRCSKYVHSDGRTELIPVTMEKDDVSIIHKLYADGFVFAEMTNVKYSMDEDMFLRNANRKELGDNLTDKEEN